MHSRIQSERSGNLLIQLYLQDIHQVSMEHQTKSSLSTSQIMISLTSLVKNLRQLALNTSHRRAMTSRITWFQWEQPHVVLLIFLAHFAIWPQDQVIKEHQSSSSKDTSTTTRHKHRNTHKLLSFLFSYFVLLFSSHSAATDDIFKTLNKLVKIVFHHCVLAWYVIISLKQINYNVKSLGT